MKTPKERTDMFEKISGYVMVDFIFLLVSSSFLVISNFLIVVVFTS